MHAHPTTGQQTPNTLPNIDKLILQLLPLDAMEADAGQVRYRLDGKEPRICADEDELAAARPPAAGRAFLVGDVDLVHGKILKS